MKKWGRQTILKIIFIATSFVFCFPVYAETINELKQKISNKGEEIERLEEEIDGYNREIVKVQAEASTLSHAISELNWTRKKLLTDISVTGNEIESTEFTIDKIEIEIENTTNKIENSNFAIGQNIRDINEHDDKTFVELLLSSEEFSEFWNNIESLQQFRSVVSENLIVLEASRNELEEKKEENEDEKRSLINLTNRLEDQKYIVDSNKREKAYLLTETKNEESEYQKLLAGKKAAKEAFEKEIADYESQLEFILNKDLLPKPGSGVLSRPLPDVSLSSCYNGGESHLNCVTQYFGNTAFANSGAYKRGHNGIDFRATTGTKVTAALSGQVVETNEGVAPSCQYGKWVLIRHGNGLTTLYAHLSNISVNKGQTVKIGQLIGDSGSTGYSLGPHLHFIVYVSEAVKFKQYQCNSGPVVAVPVAADNAYLNPLDYLAQ